MATNKELLKKASECIVSLNGEKEALAVELRNTQEKLASYEKAEKAGTIADMLVNKGAIVSSQRQEKIAELMMHDNLDEVESLVNLVTPSGSSSLGEIVQLNKKTASDKTVAPYEELALEALERVNNK